MSESYWEGQPHTLIVHSVRLPSGPLDDGDLDYEIQHPAACTKSVYTYEFATVGGESPTVTEWDCEVYDHETESGLASSLRRAGTPITEPGTYQIQGWGSKSWTELGYEYDAGVGLVDPAEVTT